MPKRIILFSSKNILKGVFDSTVIELLKAIKKYNQDIRLSLIILKEKRSSAEQELFFNQKLEQLINLLTTTDLLEINHRSLINIFTHYRQVKSFINRFPYENTVLLCQNYYTSFIGSMIKQKHPGLHFHVSLKGVVPEEHLWYGTSNFLINAMRYMVTKCFEKFFINYADSFSVVSNKFKTHLIEKYGIEKTIVVYPTVFNHQKFYYDEALRETTRTELEILPNEVLLTYSGSFQKWQNPDILFRFFSRVLEDFSHYKLLLITYDHEKAHQLIQQYQIPTTRSIVKTGPPPEVNAWLNASDICTLLRKDDLVNRVASPTKFLEYVVTRNKIIMTDHIGDYSEIIKNSNFGLVAPDLKLGTLLTLFTRIDQVEYPTDVFIQQMIRLYSIESNIDTLLSSFDA